ncbi:MAG: glycosyltransferase family A protein [Polaribacter sp.]|uniref:glycosyltransferase family A protein n=1 Tax=Polaribacter sp. TaxID=1920175 RepID=UPI002F357572
MRIGHNPEKKKFKKIVYKQHRVIIPVYIPDSDEEYFNNLFSVFKVSINSLIKTTDSKQTNITIVNNNSKNEVTDFIDSLLKEKSIDKHVKFSSNYGKVYTILSEAKASYEELITIADADVFYFSNWLENTVQVFKNFNNTGVVAPLPMPQLAFYSNSSLFSKKILNVKKGKVILDKDLLLFEESINSKISIKKNNWFKNQLYLEKNNFKVCIGAGHFIATYRKEVLDNLNIERPKYIFEDGAETFHLDNPIDRFGYYRLSTTKTFVYHLGNNIPKWVQEYVFKEIKPFEKIIETKLKNTFIPYTIKVIIAKIYRKLTTI